MPISSPPTVSAAWRSRATARFSAPTWAIACSSEIAERHGATTRQVVVRWHVEHGFVVIPKSTDPGRIAANFDVLGFTLDDSEVARIDALGR